MRYIVVFFVIMMLVLTPSCKWLRERGLFGRKADTMVVWKMKQENLRKEDSIRKAQDKLLAIEKARLDSMNAADLERKSWEGRYRYNIIIGSFVTPEYARKYSEEFALKGYNTKILKLEGTSFEMVSAEAHENLGKAISRLKQFQDTVAYDSWLYIFQKQ
jgi:hypothetical protein